MDTVSRGQMIRRNRRRRGISQEVLAGLIGRSESWLSQVERGKRKVDSHTVLTRIAEVLRVDIADLTGTEGDERDMRFAAVEEIERAMMRYSGLEATLAESDTQPVNAEGLRREADWTYAAYQATRYEDVGRRLPRLIQRVEAAAHSRSTDHPAICSTRAMVYNTTAAVLRRVGVTDLAWQAADRAMFAAESAEDPLLSAVGAYRLSYIFISRKRPGEAAELAMGAAHALERRMHRDRPEELSVYGGLHLAAATAAAAEFDRAAVPRLLSQARRAANRLGRDANLHGTAFGPTNVQIHTISTAVTVGEHEMAIREGEGIAVTSLPPGLVGRRTQVHLDLARAYAQKRMDAAAVNTLLEAEQLSPELIRYGAHSTELLTTLLRREHQRSTPQLRALAARAGIT
ncbi:helix-turn-helix transcriptional regulator [Spiractinospora alimapuensis]|uniref:helix-turn-helix domain-containing protein n=1 Tax=Spiractinospora alimapuensis TaxID=2820884 RepID=UPI001F42A5C6|nr:helix-turn-helix transcriptional regulator [Spiractinospora alimapuensis]QVQ51070.1 helix-turn-helix transcriptional regulator [Spiractinospora alimapuensis]